MARLLIWGGPVARADLHVALPADVVVLTINHGAGGGIGSSAFANLALSYKRPDGRILPHLLEAYGYSLGDFEAVMMAGFSAFHGMANEILKTDADLVDACICLDACFSAFGSLVKEGFVRFGARAARGEALFVLTGSLGGGETYSTGVDCVLANVQAAADAAGVDVYDTSVPEPLSDPALRAPTQVLQAGNLIGLDYQGSYAHGQHVHVLGGPVMESYLVPWLEGETPWAPGSSSSSSGSMWGPVALVGVGMACAFAAWWKNHGAAGQG